MKTTFQIASLALAGLIGLIAIAPESTFAAPVGTAKARGVMDAFQPHRGGAARGVYRTQAAPSVSYSYVPTPSLESPSEVRAPAPCVPRTADAAAPTVERRSYSFEPAEAPAAVRAAPRPTGRTRPTWALPKTDPRKYR